MNERIARALMAFGLCVACASPAAAQVAGGAMDHVMPGMDGAGWRVMGMGQLFPVVTFGGLGSDRGPLKATRWYLTQPTAMGSITSPGGGFAVRATLNFEGLTQEDGELSYGSWGEGFIDKRHPHTLLHELALSLIRHESRFGALSVSAGRGFAPYGTDDPMSRPGLKYPTNHHLAQILERWFLSGAALNGDWGIEAGIFGGQEPEGPYDFGNIDSFGDSWSVRLSRRWPTGDAPGWEASLSHADVTEPRADETRRTRLWNGAVRRETVGTFRYWLAEASIAQSARDDDPFSVLGEGRLAIGRHSPYARLEYAARPEYERESGADGFFRYDHAQDPVGSTRWLITTLGYEYVVTDPPIGVLPFIELQHSRISRDKGGVEPEELFGATSLWSVTMGARFYFGGGPMRMGLYGVLDPMTAVPEMNMNMGPM